MLAPALELGRWPKVVRAYVQYVGRLRDYERAASDEVDRSQLYPCLFDETDTTPFDAHYFFQPAWATRKILAAAPARHLDVGSQIDFLATLSASVPVDFVDVRPLPVELDGLHCRAGSVLALPFADDSQMSVSCMHVLEHIGLGRYGDPIDPQGMVKGARELARVLAPGGDLYVTLPIGRERICFDAHRVVDPRGVTAMFPGCALHDFAVVGDDRRLHRDVAPVDFAEARYACGLFHLRAES